MSEDEIGALEYRGNTVSYMYDKAKAYGDVVSQLHRMLAVAGFKEGPDNDVRDMLKRCIARAALASAPATPAGEAIPSAQPAEEVVAEKCLQPFVHTRCPSSGLKCGQWIGWGQREMGRLRKELENCEERIHNQRAEINRLAAPAATQPAAQPGEEACQDTERLDWLERWHDVAGKPAGHGDTGIHIICRSSDGFLVDSEYGGGIYETLREAIDAARSAQAGDVKP